MLDEEEARLVQGAVPQSTGGLPLWKRSLDLGLILIFLPALLLVGALVALVVKCGSAGPVLFRQRRVGYRGGEFTCYKFRTMQPNAESRVHQKHTVELIKSQKPMTKLDAHNDPRLIPLGALLRATGLDELPQLLNVVRGEMSIVGPRPCMPYEYELHEPWQRRRFEAVPGLTGLWQVSGKNNTTFEQMVRLDIAYSERKSLGLDLKIMFKTVPTLWKQYCASRALKRMPPGPATRSVGESVQSARL
ncbi:MAG TPA: sugar transferase [Candidatus Sulfotelmatobacter sp.]|nr:sugar transferase [Candidatus Sulfotelmatobacter sp.]HWI56839.1 sugar transferase [Bacillota bacterium]